MSAFTFHINRSQVTGDDDDDDVASMKKLSTIVKSKSRSQSIFYFVETTRIEFDKT